MIAPSDSISVAGPSQARPPRVSSSWDGQGKSLQGSHPQRRPSQIGPSTSRQRSGSSALDFRSSTTPESYLDFPGTQQSSKRGGLPRSPPPRATNSNALRPSSSASSRDHRGQSQCDKATFKGKTYCGSREATNGKICLHTHHHHYWVISDSTPLQQAMQGLQSSRGRMSLQQAAANSRFDGQMDSWPSEGDVEVLAESQRPPSRNTNHRYLIKD